MSTVEVERLPIVERLPSPEAVAARAADLFVSAAAAAIAVRGMFRVALAGGTTPRATYGLLAAQPRAGRIDWSRVQLFFGDERCVPPGHPDSNYGMVRSSLLSPLEALGLRPAEVVRIEGERPPKEAARTYAARLRDATSGGPSALDLVLLGMGRDGHTASLFPGTAAATLTDPTILAVEVEHPDLPVARVSLTLPALSAAREVVVLVTGADKAETLAAALFDPSPRLPIQRVRPTRGTLRYLVDVAAAPLLAPD